jgi:hypothetical protein
MKGRCLTVPLNVQNYPSDDLTSHGITIFGWGWPSWFLFNHFVFQDGQNYGRRTL